jgi:hypothetical protein
VFTIWFLPCIFGKSIIVAEQKKLNLQSSTFTPFLLNFSKYEEMPRDSPEFCNLVTANNSHDFNSITAKQLKLKTEVLSRGWCGRTRFGLASLCNLKMKYFINYTLHDLLSHSHIIFISFHFSFIYTFLP